MTMQIYSSLSVRFGSVRGCVGESLESEIWGLGFRGVTAQIFLTGFGALIHISSISGGSTKQEYTFVVKVQNQKDHVIILRTWWLHGDCAASVDWSDILPKP